MTNTKTLSRAVRAIIAARKSLKTAEAALRAATPTDRVVEARAIIVQLVDGLHGVSMRVSDDLIDDALTVEAGS